MIDTSKLSIELVEKKHKRADFDCGHTLLNDYLSRYARQNQESDFGKTYVAVGSNREVYGYYTFCTTGLEVDHNKILDEFRKILGRHYPNQLPAALIGRLAVDKKVKGNGLGGRLLIHALKQAYEISKTMGLWGVVVNAKDDNARKFYVKHKFIQLHSNNRYFLVLPIKMIREELEAARS